MKKLFAVLVALTLVLSMGTIAFAEGEEAVEKDELAEMLGEYAWILDVPAGTVGPALKVAMFALKLAKIYIKFCNFFKLDPAATAGKLVEFAKAQLEKANTQPAIA